MDVSKKHLGSTRCRAERAEFYFEPFCQLAPAVNRLGLFPPTSATNKSLALMNKSLECAKRLRSVKGPTCHMHSWDQMKPRTVYEKAVQDFTETAQQLARLNQHFRQASFSEFEMLMGLDDEVLKRYGLPKPTVKRALLEVYQTVVLDQQRYRDHS